jgi:hypothetical protein
VVRWGPRRRYTHIYTHIAASNVTTGSRPGLRLGVAPAPLTPKGLVSIPVAGEAEAQIAADPELPLFPEPELPLFPAIAPNWLYGSTADAGGGVTVTGVP